MCRGPGRARIGAATGLGEAEGPQHLAGDKPRQPLTLLLLAAEAVDRHRTQAHRGLEGDGDRGVDARDLLQRQAQGEVVPAHAAVLLGEGQAEEAHLPHLPHDVVGEGMRLVEIADHRRDDILGEGGDRLLQVDVLAGQTVIHYCSS